MFDISHLLVWYVPEAGSLPKSASQIRKSYFASVQFLTLIRRAKLPETSEPATSLAVRQQRAHQAFGLRGTGQPDLDDLLCVCLGPVGQGQDLWQGAWRCFQTQWWPHRWVQGRTQPDDANQVGQCVYL